MSDRFTETTSQSWFSRIKGAFGGIIVGIILFFGSFILLFWNEGRAVQTYKTLKEGAGLVQSVDAGQVNPANEGKLIHISALATTNEQLTDPLFNVTQKAIRLQRKVEMLQWQESSSSETRKKLGGGTETVTTYTYKKVWSDKLIDSSGFRKPEGHRNPSSIPIESKAWQAKDVSAGGFKLSPGLVSSISKDAPVSLQNQNRPIGSAAGPSRVIDGVMYFGSYSRERIGDVRVTLRVVAPTDVSIVSKQTGNSFTPYQTEAGGSIQMLHHGTVPAAAMFKAAQTQNTILTWALRFAGLMMMFIGIKLIVRVFSVIADVVPLFGDIVGSLTGVVAFLIALCLSLVTISVAWVFYRPLIGGALLIVAIAVAVFAKMKMGKEPADAPAES